MPNDLNLPIRVILWAGNRPQDHYNHVHVEAAPKKTGTPPLRNPGVSSNLRVILDALTERFDPWPFPLNQWSPGTTRGIYNRRKIANSSAWSQHSWSNAADIGWLYGVEQQRPIVDFLTGKEQHMDYEEIGGYRYVDVNEWPQRADANIRAAIVDGDMVGKTIPGKDPIYREWAPNDPVTRAEMATILKRNDLT